MYSNPHLAIRLVLDSCQGGYSLIDSHTMPCNCRVPEQHYTGLEVHYVFCDCAILKVETQSAGRQQHVAPVISSSTAEDRYGQK